MKTEINPERIARALASSDFQSFFSFDITPYVELHRFEKKETVTDEGEPFPYLYYLISGKVKIYMSHPNGKVSLLTFLEAPSLMGELGLIGVETQARGIQAVTPCVCLAVSLNQHGQRLLQDNQFLLRVCRLLGERVIHRTDRYTRSLSYPLENRLAALILLTEQDGLYLEKHTEAAEYLNVSYRHLLYVLSQFCQQGWLRKTGRRYWVEDREVLERLAGAIKG